MKTGKCKFGATCKFHHPKDIHISYSGNADGEQYETEARGAGTAGDMNLPSVTPALFHNSKGLPIRLVSKLWLIHELMKLLTVL